MNHQSMNHQYTMQWYCPWEKLCWFCSTPVYYLAWSKTSLQNSISLLCGFWLGSVGRCYVFPPLYPLSVHSGILIQVSVHPILVQTALANSLMYELATKDLVLHILTIPYFMYSTTTFVHVKKMPSFLLVLILLETLLRQVSIMKTKAS